MSRLDQQIRDRKLRKNTLSESAKRSIHARKTLISEAREKVLDYVRPYGFHEYGPSSGYITLWTGSIIKGDKRAIFTLEVKFNEISKSDEPLYRFANSDENLPFPSNNRLSLMQDYLSFENLKPILDEIIVEYGSESRAGGGKIGLLFIFLALAAILFLLRL